MESLKRKWKKTFIFFLKVYRAFDLGLEAAQNNKTRQDRMIIKVVSTLLESPGIKVYYLPKEPPKVYIHTKDKRFMVILSRYQIRITNHKFFFVAHVTDQMAESLINLAVSKLEKEVNLLDTEMVANEENFLSDLYHNFKRKKERSATTKSQLIDPDFPGLI